MHPILFSQKHAYLVSLAKQREWLRGFGITPARYEMLFVIFILTKSYPAMDYAFQGDVLKQLGVSAATVTKMLDALEKLGLVTRTRWKYWDKRRKCVALTQKARDILQRVKEVWIDSGRVALAISAIFRMRPEEEEGRFHWDLETVRKELGDKAIFFASWFRPD